MNEITTTQTGLAVARPTRTQHVDHALAHNDVEYLAPLQHRPWEAGDYSELIRLTSTNERTTPERGRQALALGFDADAIALFVTKSTDAVDGEVDLKATSGMIGMMVSAYPSGRPADLSVYLATLIHDATSMGFTPQVVAAACQKVRRTCKFMPSVMEFVTAAIEAKEGFDSNRRSALMIQNRLSRAKDALTYQPKLVERD